MMNPVSCVLLKTTVQDVEEGIKRAEDVKIGRPNERWVVDTSHENLYLELKNLWSERSKEFIERFVPWRLI